MSNYLSKELVKKYINGEDIHNYNIEELENDYNFMKSVIEYSNDKNIYKLCGENLKKNYQFVKFLLYRFKDDINFITEVADYYINNNCNLEQTNIEYEEIIILISNLTKNKVNEEKNIMYQTKAFVIYKKERVQIELILNEIRRDIKLSDELGLGFFFVLDNYGTSDILIKDFAKRYLFELFEENTSFNLERYLHERFINFEDLEKVGIINYFIQFIRSFDKYLADYVSVYPNLITDLISERLSVIKRNWKMYEENIIKEKIEILYNEVENYLRDKKLEYTFNTIDIIYYLSKKIGIIDMMKKYDYYFCVLDDECIDNDDYYDMLFETSIYNFNEKKALIELEKIMRNIFKSKTIDRTLNDYNQEDRKSLNNYKAKILNISSFRKK